MRKLFVMGAAILALAACGKKPADGAATGESKSAAAQAPAASPMPPKRKPGLWAQTLHTAGITQTTKICLDSDTEAKMTVWGQAVGKDACAKQSFRPIPGGWAFESTCNMGDSGTIVSKGEATGDFSSRYTVKVASTTTGASMAKANGAHMMSLDAVWEGPCPAGMKGGDVQLQIPGMKGGMTINVEQLAAHKN